MAKSDDDDLPEMAPSREDARRTLSNARARALQRFKKHTVWDAVDEEMLEVVVDLKMLREFGDEDGRKFALRELSQLWTRMPPRPALPPDRTTSPEEREARLLAAEADPGVREWLKARGWAEPKPMKERN
jgi:hypothetical protein